MISGGAGELQQKEGSKLNAKADFAKLVALNLFHFMVRQALAIQCIAAAGSFTSESDRQVLSVCCQHAPSILPAAIVRGAAGRRPVVGACQLHRSLVPEVLRPLQVRYAKMHCFIVPLDVSSQCCMVC
jgi:hypothetical protein